MTKRLYYDDSYLREFEATVVRSEPRGELRAVWLDRSCFYPSSGGQPFDTGTIDGAAVAAVEEDVRGDVVHSVRLPATAVLAERAPVTGVIDWTRRFDHMQQHSGQHVLSAMFDRLFGLRTVSVHLGSAMSTIDLAGELTPAQIAGAEIQANQAVWDNREVRIRYVSDEEAAAMPLRKESARTGTLRLIEMDGIDLSACGGTHVDRTGSIGAVAVTRWERFKGGQRIEFLCGARAVSRFRDLHDRSAATAALLSVHPEDLPRAIGRLQTEARGQVRTLAGLRGELARYRAEELSRGAEHHAAGQLVLASLDGDADSLQRLAAAVAARPGFIAVLVSAASPAIVVAARAPDVALSCHDLVTRLTRLFGGRGGGRPEMAQAGGLQAPPSEIVAAAKSALSNW